MVLLFSTPLALPHSSLLCFRPAATVPLLWDLALPSYLRGSAQDRGSCRRVHGVCQLALGVYARWISVAQDRLVNYRHLLSKCGVCLVRCCGMRAAVVGGGGASLGECLAMCSQHVFLLGVRAVKEQLSEGIPDSSHHLAAFKLVYIQISFR